MTKDEMHYKINKLIVGYKKKINKTHEVLETNQGILNEEEDGDVLQVINEENSTLYSELDIFEEILMDLEGLLQDE